MNGQDWRSGATWAGNHLIRRRLRVQFKTITHTKAPLHCMESWHAQSIWWPRFVRCIRQFFKDDARVVLKHVLYFTRCMPHIPFLFWHRFGVYGHLLSPGRSGSRDDRNHQRRENRKAKRSASGERTKSKSGPTKRIIWTTLTKLANLGWLLWRKVSPVLRWKCDFFQTVIYGVAKNFCERS